MSGQRNYHDEVVATLREIESHHSAMCRGILRPEHNSKTLRLVRGALAGMRSMDFQAHGIALGIREKILAVLPTPAEPANDDAEQLAACREDWTRACEAVTGRKGEHLNPDELVERVVGMKRREDELIRELTKQGAEDDASNADLVAEMREDWQPIETAPERDAVLVHHASYWGALACKHEDGSWWRWRAPVGNEPLNFRPTHWMPLPEPPK